MANIVFEKRAEKLDLANVEIKSQIENMEQKLEELSRTKISIRKWQDGLSGPVKRLETGDSDLRLRTRKHLAGLIERIDIYTHGYEVQAKEPLERNGAPNQDDFWFALDDLFHDYLPEYAGSRKFKRFAKDVLSLRMSKAGRFIRVFFKTGNWVDFATEASLASVQELVTVSPRSWKHRFPILDNLCKKHRID